MKELGEGQCPFGFGAGSAGKTDAGDKPAAAADDGEYATHKALAPAMSRDLMPKVVKEPIVPSDSEDRTGRCACGRVSFRIEKPVSMVFANHDAGSRRRSGGVSLTFMIRAQNTTFFGWGNLVNWQASEHEVSCFCRICGTPILTRFLAPQQMAGMLAISAGSLDNLDGLSLAADISADERPDLYAFEGERREISSAELSGMFQ